MVKLESIDKRIIKDNSFLEFYGTLIGDGWLGRYKYKNKVCHIVGISGHSILDREYFDYCRGIIFKLLDRNISIKEKKRNAIELYFSHKSLVKFLNEHLDFPVGKKMGKLKISDKVINLGDSKLKYVIRGIFDTDGSFFMDRVYKYSYPNIKINMIAPELLDQIESFLKRNGFKPQRRMYKVRLKGIKQVQKWMNEIGSSNPKHFNKYTKWLNNARVA